MPADHGRRFDEYQGIEEFRPQSVKILCRRDGRRRFTIPDFATPCRMGDNDGCPDSEQSSARRSP
jgi:hypothetical protein